MEYYEYYAKSNGQSVKDHLEEVSDLAKRYGLTCGMKEEAALAGKLHDFGKYTAAFQNVLKGTEQGVDHAICGALPLYKIVKNNAAYCPVVEAISAHHSELVEFSQLDPLLYDILRGEANIATLCSKRPAVSGMEEIKTASAAFFKDFPEFGVPRLPCLSGTQIENMLHTRMLFSCLVDADYSASAHNEDSDYFDYAEKDAFDVDELLRNLGDYRAGIQSASRADNTLNALRNSLFEQCGRAGMETEGLFTLTAPTGTGKTLALLNFALRHCKEWEKKRIIIVLPFLTLAEQNAETYRKIIPDILVDHSQSDLPDEARELAAKWSSPVVITTSVRFFESLFSSKPSACRKLHNIANSVVIFDEAQSLPANLLATTLQAVNALCRHYHTTIVFSTATQPDYSALRGLDWQPHEICPDHAQMYRALHRTEVEWRTAKETPLCQIAEEMATHLSVCTIVNLRRHARELANALIEYCPSSEVFFLTTDLCPAHRTELVKTIKDRLQAGFPCRVVATQCIEAGVDLDFEVMFRALAPLDSIIQAAGRCNRNGQIEKGTVIVFRPADTKNPYPDDWYQNAALKVLEMQPPFSIHDPENIRKYFQLLFRDAADKETLAKAIKAGSYHDTAQEYKLIPNEGARIIVPYSGEAERYERVAAVLRRDGLTKAILHDCAPITVTSFARNLDTFAEAIPYANRYGTVPEMSNVYLLRPQYLADGIYTPQFGLQLPIESNSIF